MAAPNIVNVSTITAKTKTAQLTTSLTDMVSNASSSGKVFKINTILVANVDGTNGANVTVDVVQGSTGRYLALTILVAANSTLVLLDKNSVIYLEEDHKIRASASANSDLDIIISYEEIS